MKKVLIVDDSPALLELYEFSLKGEGFETVTAQDGKEALEKTKREKPDIIVLDLLMPGMDGFDFLSEKGNHREISGIPVIVLSNLDGKEDIKKAKELGAIDFCVKYDNTAEDMVKKIKEIIE